LNNYRCEITDEPHFPPSSMESPVRSREKGKGEFPALFAIYITFDSLIRFAISSSLIEPATVRLNLISFPQPCPCNRLARPGPRAATKEGKELKRIICR
jgi:hypothetical protein